MKYVFSMQNASGSLSKECQHSYGPEEAWKCIMAPYAALHIKTPWFALQSRFDHWQLAEELFLGCVASQPYSPPYPPAPKDLAQTCTPPQKAAIEQYGPDFMAEFSKVMASSDRNGAFVDACIIHGSTNSSIDGLNNNAAFEQWRAATEQKVGSAKKSWWLMGCPDGTGKMSTSAGPCDTSSICLPFSKK